MDAVYMEIIEVEHERNNKKTACTHSAQVARAITTKPRILFYMSLKVLRAEGANMR